MIFPIYIHQAESGTYSGFVPDIAGCYFAGATIDATIQDADAAIDAHLEFLADEGQALPVANTIEFHKSNDSCVDGVWAYVNVDLSKYDGKSIKLNITLPQNLIARIDQYVATHPAYGSRSGFLAAVARNEIQKSA
ncbi:type II toxin-antitoxin system HicB family antitoxin [Nissabacter sp. SGAir0207]|uniref:type II toxin-antitoxin system HicB family antitoxin n=1 Tax=Nissabacter sp. SGAir0207 TaxID=2126321 RepID=UPI0010CCD459|nr:type II toxin-antitoxin system HicB family antitoxin [Nissabacter sp. SGAir0207]QCR38714.1 hypothetical protein C1N62_21495 [Nissabacter sp. SGAir0207]